MNTETRHKVGRPTKEPQDGERVMLGLRVTADVKRKLDAAAVESGRSQSQEAELRLQQTFDKEAITDEVVKKLWPLFRGTLEELKKEMEKALEAKERLLAVTAKSEAEDK